MAITDKLIAFGIIFVSLVAGIISFYTLTDLPKEQKMKLASEISSQVINFILFVLLGKIIVNITVFIQDPLAVLAYPSDSKAFYLAIAFIAGVFIYKQRKKQLELLPFMEAFTHVFITAAFVYEFIQFIWYDNPFAFGNMILYGLLLLFNILIRLKLSQPLLLLTIVSGWVVGYFILRLVQPFVTVYGYIMEPWFTVIFFLITSSSLIISYRKRVKNG